MSFKPVRTFFQARLNEVDRDFREHLEAFNVDNVPSSNFNKKYHIFYGNVTTTTANQNTTEDVVNATVTLFFTGLSNTQSALDDAMDLANEFRLNCLRQSKLSGQTFIKRVTATSIEAQPLETNDKAIKVILQFSIKVIFGTNVNLNA